MGEAAVSSAAGLPFAGRRSGDGTNGPIQNGKTEFTCDVVETRLRTIPDGRMQFDQLWLRGNVAISHQALRADDSFTAQGNLLHAAVSSFGQYALHLSGDPASVIRNKARIDGPRIELKEATDSASSGNNSRSAEATVEGGGRLRMVVSRAEWPRTAKANSTGYLLERADDVRRQDSAFHRQCASGAE